MSDVDDKVTSTPSEKKPASKKPEANSNTNVWLYCALALAIFVGGIFAQPYAKSGLLSMGLIEEEIQSDPRLDAMANEIAVLERNIDGLATTIETLRQEKATLAEQIKSPAAEGMLDSAINERLDALEESVNNLATMDLGSDDPAVTALLTSLSSDIKKLQADNASLALRISNFNAASNDQPSTTELELALVVARILHKLDRGEGYQSELMIIESQLGTMSALDAANIGDSLAVLRSNVSGVATTEQLANDFHALIPTIYGGNTEDRMWWERFFTVRTTDNDAGGIDKIVREIEAALGRRDLDTTQSLIAALNEQQRAQLNDWSAKLDNRIATLSALETLLSFNKSDEVSP